MKKAAGVLAESRKCIEMTKKKYQVQGIGGKRKRAINKKMSKAMGQINVKFGATNFVDTLTPFNMANRVLSDCVSLMLLKHK